MPLHHPLCLYQTMLRDIVASKADIDFVGHARCTGIVSAATALWHRRWCLALSTMTLHHCGHTASAATAMPGRYCQTAQPLSVPCSAATRQRLLSAAIHDVAGCCSGTAPVLPCCSWPGCTTPATVSVHIVATIVQTTAEVVAAHGKTEAKTGNLD
jgi:hypothetical protein